MLIKKTSAAVVCILLMAPQVHAADGSIEFTGELVASTCTINGGGVANDFEVALPQVSAAALQTAGSWAGRTPFEIKLTACSPATGKVSAYFEPGASINPDTGRLIVDDGGATNVEIGLLSDSFGSVVAGAAVGSQNSQVIDIVGGAANLKYYAQYESLGSATAGAVVSRVQYTLIYE
jgi:major type 1 subunit fimbrin (pilin)